MPRQTLSYLRQMFARRGIAPQHRYGQNFLIDLNIHDLIVRTAELGPEDVVLEVGSGAGALTTRLAGQAGAVVAVEIDPALAELTREAVAGFGNVTVLRADVLAGKHRLDGGVVAAVRERLGAEPGRRLKLVANLPFNVATPLITNLLVDDELRPAMMVVTIQREVAERLVAEPGRGSYGALTVLVQALCEVELVRVLAPSVFWPRPKVESAIVKLVTDRLRREAIADLGWFHWVVRQVFLHRRKNLRGAIAAIGGRGSQEGQGGRGWSKAEVDAVLAEQGLDGGLRAEALNVEEWIELAEALRRHGGGGLEGTAEAD